jgi:apolipoprotein N-acyltransferase
MMQASNLTLEQIGDSKPQSFWDILIHMEKMPIALLFGCLLGLSSAGFDHSWLAFCGLAPLLVLLTVCRSKTEAAVTGFVFGLGYHLVALSWYFGLFPLRWMGVNDVLAAQAISLVWFLESAHEALMFAAFAWLIASLPTRPGFLPYIQRPFFPYMFSIPFIWYFLHWVVAPSVFFLGIPIDQLAYSQSHNILFIQLAKLGGAGAVDFILILVNAAVAGCLIEFPKSGRRPVERVDVLSPRIGAMFDITAASLVVAVSMWWGATQVDVYGNLEKYSLEKASSTTAPRLPIAVVQGNVTVEEDRLKTTSVQEIAARQAQLSHDLGVAILVLPEGAISPAQRAPGCLLSVLKSVVDREKKEVIAGSFDRVGGNILNSAFLLEPDQKTPQLYLKNQLIPFFEWWPWQDARNELPETFRDKLPSVRNNFVKAAQTELLKSSWGKVGVSISAELIYPQVIAQEVRKGASLLVNVSNLAWFHNASLTKQLLAAATFRAVENERFLIISSNTGISAVIDPAGIVSSASLPGRRGTLIDTVQFLVDKTLFTKMWWL